MAVPQYNVTITTHLRRIRTIPHPSAATRRFFRCRRHRGGTARWPFPTNSRRAIPKRRGRRPRRPICRNAAVFSCHRHHRAGQCPAPTLVLPRRERLWPFRSTMQQLPPTSGESAPPPTIRRGDSQIARRAPPKNQPEAIGFGLFSFYWLCSPSGLGLSLSSILVRAFSMDA